MRNKRRPGHSLLVAAGIIAIAAAAGIIFLYGAPARAYSITTGSGAAPAAGGGLTFGNIDLGGIVSQLQNFFQDLGSTGNIALFPLNGPSAMPNGTLFTMDNFSRLLGTVKNAIHWLSVYLDKVSSSI